MIEKYRERLEKIYSKKPPLVMEARILQKELREKVVAENGFSDIRLIAGADIAILPREKKMICGVVLFSYPQLNLVEKVWSLVDEQFPYIPGLLAFREGPAIIRTINKLKKKPDVLILDGHGIAHPRAFGIACHVGVLLDIPSFGIGKKKLYGEYSEPGPEKGSVTNLISKVDNIVIGKVLRTRDNTRPVFVSVGNKIDLDSALELTMKCDSGFRIPVPTRAADKFVAEVKSAIKL